MDTDPGWDTVLHGELIWDLVVDRTGELGVRRFSISMCRLRRLLRLGLMILILILILMEKTKTKSKSKCKCKCKCKCKIRTKRLGYLSLMTGLKILTRMATMTIFFRLRLRSTLR